jgi:hypothetical protein
MTNGHFPIFGKPCQGKFLMDRKILQDENNERPGLAMEDGASPKYRNVPGSLAKGGVDWSNGGGLELSLREQFITQSAVGVEGRPRQPKGCSSTLFTITT